jgi:hypothetical protein
MPSSVAPRQFPVFSLRARAVKDPRLTELAGPHPMPAGPATACVPSPWEKDMEMLLSSTQVCTAMPLAGNPARPLRFYLYHKGRVRLDVEAIRYSRGEARASIDLQMRLPWPAGGSVAPEKEQRPISYVYLAGVLVVDEDRRPDTHGRLGFGEALQKLAESV